MSILILIVGLLLFIGLVVVHEFGHFIVARRNGVVAEEFGIFFPPRLWSRKMKGGWIFSINALPVGGFVKLKGEHDTDTEPGSYGAASIWAKTKIMAAGVVMNLAVALVLFTIVSLFGMPQLVSNQFTIKSDTRVTSSQVDSSVIDQVLSGSPAAHAGLKAKDQVTALGPPNHLQAVSTVNSLQILAKSYAGQSVIVQYKRAGQLHSVSLTLNTTSAVNASARTANPKAYLGVALEEDKSGLTLLRSTWSAPIVAVGTAWQFTVLTVQGLGHALAGLGGIIAGATTSNHVARENAQTQASSQVGGPVAIFFVFKDGSTLGWIFMLFIVAILSLTLAIINILPIPALDGGRLWLTLIMRALKKPLSPAREELINAIGFILLLTLMAVITLVDVKRFF